MALLVGIVAFLIGIIDIDITYELILSWHLAAPKEAQKFMYVSKMHQRVSVFQMARYKMQSSVDDTRG